MASKFGLLIGGGGLAIFAILIGQANYALTAQAQELDTSVKSHPALGTLLSSIKQASARGTRFMSDLIISIPFAKIALASGALLSIFFLFVRLIIVLGPILILGAMTRESNDATDFVKMLIDFYNQVVVAMDDQQMSNTMQAQ